MGFSTSIDGVPNAGIDSEIQRLENWARDGLEPRIVGIHIRRVVVNAASSIIAILIPQSLNPPHRVIAQGTNRFFARNSNGKHEASVEELRHMFGYATRLSDEIQRFVRHRRQQIVSGTDFVDDSGGGRLIVHIVNVPTFGNADLIDIEQLYQDPYRFAPYDISSSSKRVLLEGILVGEESGSGFDSRNLIFRDGTFEAVYSELHRNEEQGTLIPGKHLMDSLIYSVDASMRLAAELGGGGPFVVNAAVSTLPGVGIAFYNHTFRRHPKFDRALVELPPLALPQSIEHTETPHAIRPILNALWNSVGIPSCGYFNGDDWKPPK